MDLANIRSFFPGTQGRTFLDTACIGLLPAPAEDAIKRLTHSLGRCAERDASAHHIGLDRTADEPRREAARLIGAPPEQIALVESTTHGLEIIAASVPLQAGDKVLVGATEFMGLAVPWVPRQQTQGIRIEVVPHHEGRVRIDDYARAVDAQTRLILLSSVQWNNGFRADLEAFCTLAKERNITLVVDAIQQLGAVRFDVNQTPVDFLVCGGHKWLNAPVGRGFLYLHPRQLERLSPTAWGYLNITEPSQGWARYFATPETPAVGNYSFVREARRFEIGGTSNYLGNAALGAALNLINELGMEVIENHIFKLTDLLIERLNSAGAKVVTPAERAARSGIVTFTLGQGPRRDTAFLQRLLNRKIFISQRYTAGVGGLRVSPHLFNTENDIHQLLELVVEEMLQATPFAGDAGLV
jgi:selenocysteine lyase/cysteine desulfurase